MVKENKNSFKIILLVVIVAVIAAGLTFVITWQAMSQKVTSANVQGSNNKELAKTMIEHDMYKDTYFKERTAISNRMDKINTTLDYTSCMAWNSVVKEQNTLFNDDELKTVEYYSKLAGYVNTTRCNSKISDYKDTQKKTAQLRKDYADLQANVCYGFHKVAWSETWSEEYMTPWSQATDKLSASEAELGTADSAIIDACLSELIK